LLLVINNLDLFIWSLLLSNVEVKKSDISKINNNYIKYIKSMVVKSNVGWVLKEWLLSRILRVELSHFRQWASQVDIAHQLVLFCPDSLDLFPNLTLPFAVFCFEFGQIGVVQILGFFLKLYQLFILGLYDEIGLLYLLIQMQ
jgi:hypothetical protein